MKRIFKSAAVLLFAVVTACSTTKSDSVQNTVEQPAAKPAAKAPQARDTFKTADQFDPNDVAAIHKMRDEWVSAFSRGDEGSVDFMFTDDALFTLPAGVSAKQIFKQFSAQLVFDEQSEQFVTDGGDPRKTTKLPWVSYYTAYKLSLTPRQGGPALESNGKFMTRFHRQADGSLKVMRGFSSGQRTLDFTLNLMNADGNVQLSALRGKPTVLIFGSYT